MMEEEGTIDFDGLTPKELTKLYKTVVKEVKNKDIDEKLKALAKVVNTPRYLLEGGAIVPFIESITTKKKVLDYSASALEYLLQYLEDSSKTKESPALEAMIALQRLSSTKDNLDSLKGLVSVISFKQEFKKPKKGEIFEPDYTLQNKLRFSSSKALSLFSKDIIVSNNTVLRSAFTKIPMLLESLHIALKEFTEKFQNIGKLPESTPGEGGEDESEPAAADEAALAAFEEDRINSVPEGICLLDSLLACLSNSDDRKAQFLEIEGAVQVLFTLMSRPEFAKGCLRILQVLSIFEPAIVSISSTIAMDAYLQALQRVETNITTEATYDSVCEAYLIMKILNVFAPLEGVWNDENIIIVVKSVGSMQIPTVWELARLPLPSAFDVTIHDFVAVSCVLLGSMGLRGVEYKEKIVDAGAGPVLVSILEKSAEIIGWTDPNVDGEGEEEPSTDAEASQTMIKRRLLSLRRVAEKALLELTSTHKPDGIVSASNALHGTSWESCDVYVCDEHLFYKRAIEGEAEGEETGEPEVSLEELISVLYSPDEDLMGRAVRTVAATVLSSSDPVEFATHVGMGVDAVKSIKSVLFKHGKHILEELDAKATLLQVPGGNAKNITPPIEADTREEDDPTAPADVTEAPEEAPSDVVAQSEGKEGVISDIPVDLEVKDVDLLLPGSPDTFCLALLLLRLLLPLSAENINEFCADAEWETLIQILYRCGPCVSQATEQEEMDIPIYDPRSFSWYSTPDESEFTTLTARSLLLDVITIVAESASKYRTFEEDVPPAQGSQLPVCDSPCQENAIVVCKAFADASVSILLMESKFVLESSNAVGIVPAQKERAVEDVVVNSALSFITAAAKGGYIGMNSLLEGVATKAFVAKEEYNAVQTSMNSLQKYLEYVVAVELNSSTVITADALKEKVEVEEEGEGDGEAEIEGEREKAEEMYDDIYGEYEWTASTTFDVIFKDDTSVLLNKKDVIKSKTLWPYITLCGALVGLLKQPSMGVTTSSLCIQALEAVTKDSQFSDFIQPSVNDVCAVCILALGGGVALSSNIGRFGQIPNDKSGPGLDLLTYLIHRASSRSDAWPTIEVHEDGEKAEANPPPTEGLPFESDGVDSDPNHGPYPSVWGGLLSVVVDDLHAKTTCTCLLSTLITNYQTDQAIDVVKSGGEVNHQDSTGRSPLMYAFVYENLPVVDALLEADANPNACDKSGNPVWKFALMSVSPTILQDLSPNRIETSNDPVVVLGAPSGLAALLAVAKLDILSADSENNGIGLVANGRGMFDICIGGRNFIFKNRAYDQSQPEEELVGILTALMDAGASLSVEANVTGTTPLHIASARGHVAAMTVMMEQGCDPNIRDSNGFIALHYVCAACPENSEDAIELLLKYGENKPLKDPSNISNARSTKTAYECQLLDMESAFADMDLVLNPNNIYQKPLSRAELLNTTTNMNRSPLLLCMVSHRLSVEDLIISSDLITGGRDERLATAQYLVQLMGRDPTLYDIVDKSSMNILHAMSLLCEGVSPSIKANPKSRVGARYGSHELEILSILWEIKSDIVHSKCDLFVPSANLQRGWTAIHGCISGGNSEMLATLIEKSRFVLENSEPYCYFMSQLPTVDSNVAQIIVEKTASCESPTTLFNEPSSLHAAVTAGNIVAIDALVRCPIVDPNVKQEGRTAFSLAASNTSSSTLELIEAFGPALDRTDLLIELPDGSTCVDMAITKALAVPSENALINMFIEKRKNDVIEGLIRSRSGFSSFLQSPMVGDGSSQAIQTLTILEILEGDNIALAKRCGYKEKKEVTILNADENQATIGAEVEEEVVAIVDESGVETKEGEDMPIMVVVEGVEEEIFEPTKKDLDALDSSDALLNLILPLINDTAVLGSDFHKHNCFANGMVFRNYCSQ